MAERLTRAFGFQISEDGSEDGIDEVGKESFGSILLQQIYKV
jgi:hypothetical protein